MPKKKAGAKKKKKGENVKIFARVRNLMPWEPRKTSLQVCAGNKLRNKTDKHTNEYQFNKVFGIDINNEEIQTVMVAPMIDNVLKGFNAVLIAYGQTGSGKTFTMLGKPNLGVLGLLPRTLGELVDTPSVHKLELSAVEAFGHHVAKIELYDLYFPHNQTPSWGDKKGDTGKEMHKAIRKNIANIDEAYTLIRYAHAASHFAPTGKNPESSRGHVTFVAKVYQDHGTQDLISFFLFLDCAGSEGESAFTKDFIASCDKTTLMARRLEAGCINTGLSSLQIIFNELRVKGKLSNMLGIGLRRVLHPFINTRTILAVLFTFSPSVNNAKPTESTLKFAVTAGMVKVQPVKAELSMNVEKLVQQLRKHIEENDKIIDDQENKILGMTAELEQLKQDLMVAGGDFQAIQKADADEYGQYGGDISQMGMGMGGGGVGASKYKGKDVKHLEKSILDKLKYLDDDDSSDDGFGMDDMFNIDFDNDFQAQLDADLNASYQADQKGGAAKLLQAAVGIAYDPSVDVDAKDIDVDDISAKLQDTLDVANEDVSDIQARFDAIADMTGDQIKLDFDQMNTDQISAHCEETWDQIAINKQTQTDLKQTQENVVGHLVTTNEWLFAALQDTLNSQL